MAIYFVQMKEAKDPTMAIYFVQMKEAKVPTMAIYFVQILVDFDYFDGYF